MPRWVPALRDERLVMAPPNNKLKMCPQIRAKSPLNWRRSEHMLIKISPEGIVVEITDSDKVPLFPVGRSDPSILLDDLLKQVATAFGGFQNNIKIVGHTDNRTFRNAATYDNWNLSADRANTARRLLVRSGLSRDRIVEVSGKADSDPLVEDDPSAAQNRRISITILTQ